MLTANNDKIDLLEWKYIPRAGVKSNSDPNIKLELTRAKQRVCNFMKKLLLQSETFHLYIVKNMENYINSQILQCQTKIL